MLGPLAAPFLEAGLAVAAPERPRLAGVDVRPIETFGDDYDALWESARGSYAMCVRRDRAYLNWKYVACPHRAYERSEARRGSTLAGYAVSRHEDYQGTRLGWILDVFTAAGDAEAQDALIGGVLDGFRRAGVVRAQCFAMNASLAVVTDKGRWHVTFVDSDMDR